MSIASAAVVTSLTGSACTGGAPTVTNASRCGTGSVSLTASGASGSQVYRWYDAPTSGTLVNSVASYITPSLSSTTSYYVAIYDPSTLAESSRTASTVTIVNISTPVIAGPGTVSICAGSSTLLSAPGGYITYLWSNGATTQQIQISTAANYSVQAGDGTCTSAISNLIVVSVVPAIAKPTISITGNTTLCGSGTVQLTAPVAPNYAWSNGATIQSIIVSAAGSYSVTLSNGTCTSPTSDPILVTSVVVPAQPSIQITGPLALCSTGIVGLAAPTGSNNYLWSTLETTPQIVVTAAGAGVYSLQVGNASNCLSVASNTVTVTSTGLTCPTNGVVTPPSVTNNSRCDAGSVSLTASGAITGQVYRWYDLPTSGTLLFTGPSYTTPSIATTTNYYATIFDATNGESTPTMATAIVVIMPTPVLSGPGSIPICTGNNTLLSAPLGFVQYKWSNTVTTQQLQVNSAGSYSVQVGDGTCLSSASNLISVSVSPVITKPALTVSGNTTLCGSATVDLSAPPGYQYVWSTGANTQTVTASSAGNYSVTLSNGVCTSPASDPLVVTSVTSPAKPSIVVTGTTALCNSAFVAMEAPGGFSNYLWSNGETTKGIVVSTAGSYKVQAGSAGTCLSVLSDAVIVTTTGVPCPSGITPPIATNGIRCGEGTVALNASGAAAGLAYRWYATATSTAVLFTGPIFTTPVLAGSTSYFTSVYDPSTTGESTRVLATATINSLPKPTLNKTGTVSICAGSSLVLSAPTGIAQYLWSNGAVTQQLSVTISGNYSVQTGDGTCLSVASDAVTVSVATVPTKPAVAVSAGTTALCGGGSVTLGAPAGFNYKWSDNSATQQITISKSGNFSVIVTNNAGCESVASDQIIVTAFAIPIKPSITVDGSTNLCIGAKVLLSAPAGFAAYHWSGGQTTQQIAVDKAGAYTVAVGNAASCLSISSDAIAVVETKLECIQPAPPGNHPPEIKPSTATTAIEGKISLNLKDLIRDADGNLNINSLRITQQPPSGAVATIDAQFNLHVDYTNIRFSGTEELTIQVCDLSNSCTQQEVTLQVAGDVEAFNALSPNGDGMNDKLLLEYIEIIPETKTNLVTIYNRWGNSIFEIVNYDNINHVFVGLDRNGNELPNDTYYYKIEFNSGKNSKEGFITLRR